MAIAKSKNATLTRGVLRLLKLRLRLRLARTRFRQVEEAA